MKAITLVFALVTISLVTYSQVIQLKFTALFNGAHVNIDSVRVSNLTHPGDTILHWPDTTLLIGYVGIPDVGINQLSAFDIRLGSANPCNDRAVIQLSVPASGNVDLRITDISGKLVQKISRYLTKGEQSFLYLPGKQGVSFVSASFKSQVKSLKIVYVGTESLINKLEYMSSGDISISPKSTTSTLSFTFAIGDILQLSGWYNGSDTVIYAVPQTSSNYSFNFSSNNSCPGLPQFTYGGQVYHTVQIGTQCLMRENLNIGTYVTSISTGNDHTDVSNNGIIEKYCYNNDQANCAIYGGLYDWNEMMQYDTIPGIQGICPAGWHIPTDAEWSTLENFLGGSSVAGGKMKETGFVHWLSPNTAATNISGFTALGAGDRYLEGSFDPLRYSADFWSSSQYSYTKAWEKLLLYNDAGIYPGYGTKTFGFSLRCFKD